MGGGLQSSESAVEARPQPTPRAVAVSRLALALTLTPSPSHTHPRPLALTLTKVSPDVIEAEFDEYDLDKSGAIDYQEYVVHSVREALAASSSRVRDLLRSWGGEEAASVDRAQVSLVTP